MTRVSFSDGSGRVGRMIMFRECLYNDIMPFFIEDRNKDFYIRGIKEYQTNNEKGYLIAKIIMKKRLIIF